MPDGEKTELAEDRTKLAEDRTILATERTFAGWMRTGFAAVGIGLGFHVLFQKMEPAWMPKAIATTFLLIAIFLLAIAERKANRVMSRLEAHSVETFKLTSIRLVTMMSITAVLALVGAIWLLEIG
jgi:putative membrane protein